MDGKSFKTTLAATGKIRAEKAPATKADVAPDAWLTFDAPTYEEKDGIWYTTFVFKSTDATGKQPVNVTFINDAASYDPDLDHADILRPAGRPVPERGGKRTQYRKRGGYRSVYRHDV